MKKTGAELIIEERKRQITAEGFSAEHDTLWKNGELTRVAMCYIQHANALAQGYKMGADVTNLPEWPFNWAESWWKPADPVRDLAKAGALIAAEIDRLLRWTESKER
jgi:hypothetical protein